jgi:hypothetical protein
VAYLVATARRAPVDQSFVAGAPGAPSIQVEWTYTGPLPDWKLTVPIDEPLAGRLPVHCRFVSVELGATERPEASTLLRHIASGHAKVVHPGAEDVGEYHHPHLAAMLEERPRSWVVECSRGFRFDVIAYSPEPLLKQRQKGLVAG